MKRTFALILVTMLILSLAACGAPAAPSSAPSQAAGSSGAESVSQEAPTTDWPKQPITVACPSKAGGGTDITIRAFTDTWSKALGTSVVVSNYDATPVGMQACVDAKADGYTVVCHQNTVICQYVTGVLDVNPMEELSLVAALQYMGEQALIVPANAPYNNFSEFIAYAKENPGKVSVAIATGGPAQILWGQVMMKYDVKLNMVVAANTTEKLTSISGGFIDCGQVDTANARDYETAGKVKVIGVLSTSGENLQGWPEHWSTLQKQGYDVGWDMRLYMWAPAGTPEDVLQAMNASLKPVMEDETVIATLGNTGARAEWYNLEDSRKILKDEYDSILAVAKELGIATVE